MSGVLVLGAGVSGVAAAKFARSLGHQVSITNDKPISEELRTELEALKIEILVGPQTADQLKGKQTLILSPGISETHPIIAHARDNGVESVSEIDFALKHFKGHLIGITGTNGKSTTTAMTAHILLKLNKKAAACGNIGLAPSQILFEKKRFDFWVMELSSYQISISDEIRSDVVLFTSFTPDHLGRHGTIEAYLDAKLKLCSMAKSDAQIFISQEVKDALDRYQRRLPSGKNIRVLSSTEQISFAKTSILTNHDKMNAMFAATAVHELIPDVSEQGLINLLEDFVPLPFRYNLVGYTMSKDPIINDSKATNVDSTLKALENQKKPCLLLLGGKGKGESYLPVLEYRDRIEEVWCFGESGAEIENDLANRGIRLRAFPSLKLAMIYMQENFESIDMPILFSPACASFDEFKNFEDRGQFFNREVSRYAKPIRSI